MKAVLFDLDDTLYPEIDFVYSGFKTVAKYLQKSCGVDSDEMLQRMVDLLRKNGRGKVFDDLLSELRLDIGAINIDAKLLVYIYRTHKPLIRPFSDTSSVLNTLKEKGFKLGIITDGTATVQRNKIASLGIKNLFDIVICTDDLGKDAWKPSLIPFQIALKLLKIKPLDAICVGDNLMKDFVSANTLGIKTIRTRQAGNNHYIPEDHPDPAYHAIHEIQTLTNMLPIVMEFKHG